jgi:hypothetical protein
LALQTRALPIFAAPRQDALKLPRSGRIRREIIARDVVLTHAEGAALCCSDRRIDGEPRHRL